MTTDLDLRPAAVKLALDAEQLVRLLNSSVDERQVADLAATIADRAAAIAEALSPDFADNDA